MNNAARRGVFHGKMPILRLRRPQLLVASLACLTVVGGCSDLGGILAPLPRPTAASHPGFDTSIYPGDAAMRTWRAASPYEWAGYYLAAPCHADATWSGRRATLAAQGWGTAVVYVGQQTWESLPVAPFAGGPARAVQAATCSRTLLSGAQGTIDAIDAIAKTANEGFPRGSTIFLDIEYMSTLTAAMREYYRSWIAQLLADGRYLPGVYCHRSNAAAIHDDVVAEFMAQRHVESPRFWIAGGSGFSIDRAPADVGHTFANVWQGRLDTNETWGGVPLHIDVDVADRSSPSGS